MKQPLALFWFRRDLRLDDNAGLSAALSSGLPVLPIFIFDKDILVHLQDKDDKRVSFIYTTLLHLHKQLTDKGSSLDVRYGHPLSVFEEFTHAYNVQAVYTNHDFEPSAIKRDKQVENLLAEKGIAFHSYKDQVIFEKTDVVKDDGTAYAVYTPYAKRWRATVKPEALKSHPSEKLLAHLAQRNAIPFLPLTKMGFTFNPAVDSFPTVDNAVIRHYHQTRDIPSLPGTTRLGIHLRFGTISIRKLVRKALDVNQTFLGELIWREFFMQTLWHQPRLVNEACKKEYDNIKWRNDESEFERWCAGQTGFPIVDAGMRELNETGFMHNRVRMIAASFLVKDLLIDWRWGEAYFARKLLDFDLASNNGNWQWVAGCGCDAAPYFRVFNPTIQAKKFDPQTVYTRRWIPELESLSYPAPMIEHEKAKQRCIKAYKAALVRSPLPSIAK